MSILIKGATVPETCFECMAIDGLHLIIEELGGHCMMAERIIDPRIFRARERRLPNCPLVAVEAPHGRLIDAEALFEKGFEQPARRMMAAYKASEDPEAAEAAEAMLMAEFHIIKAAPTIIEAEEGAEE